MSDESTRRQEDPPPWPGSAQDWAASAGDRSALDGEWRAESFGQRIQRIRRRRGLTQREVASRLGIDFTYLSKMENDRGEPPGDDTIRRLAALLETGEEMLLAMAGKVPPGLRDRARNDVEFARFLQRLPSIPDSEMREIYEKLGISEETENHA